MWTAPKWIKVSSVVDDRIPSQRQVQEDLSIKSEKSKIIVEVLLLKIVLHYVPSENQADDPLKKLSIFFLFELPDRVFF